MMRRALLSLVAILFLAACGPFGPDAPTPSPPTPTAGATTPPTSAAPATAPAPTDTAAPAPTATVSAAPPTAEATGTPVAGQSPAPGATAAASGSPTADAGPEATAAPETLRQVTTIESEASSVRGLKPKRDVPEHFVSSAQIKSNLTKEIDTEYPPADAKRDALEGWLMRLLPDRSLDLHQLQIDLLGEQVLGYYSPDSKELFVRNDQQPLGAEAQETLAHEFTHSLQDEYYDLNKMRPRNSTEADADLATTSLIEGDATLSGVLFAQKYMSKADYQALITGSGGSQPELDRAPVYVRESLLFPYDQGAQFVINLWQRGGFGAVNKALGDPPRSSEQIMHPEKYTNTPRDNPQPVTLPPLTSTLGAGWTLQDSKTLGEFDLDVMLRVNQVADDVAGTAAAGWGGSRYALYQNGADGVVIVGTRWDTTRDANEFEAAMRQSFANDTVKDGIWQDVDRYYALKRTGAAITFLGGTDRAAVAHALGAVK
jgi:hypothetical protein